MLQPIIEIEANEALFLEDNIILVEGQEDVIILKRKSKELDIPIKGNFLAEASVVLQR